MELATGWINVMIYILWTSSLLLLYGIMKWRQRKRIDEIMKLIKQLNRGDYSIPMKQDDFAILEDQIYKLFLMLVEEREQIKKLSDIQIENLENISHQIKTPITTMLLDLQLLEIEQGVLQEFHALKLQLKRLNSLVDILLKLSSLDAQVDKMNFEEFYIHELIDYVFDILNQELERNNIQLITEINEELIRADFYWVSEGIINIIKNAINLPKCTYIKITTMDNPIYTSILIEDNGGGIKKEYINKIFQRFYKTPDSNGFGIGLAMAKTIIKNNNGEISVENGEDGAIFNIKFYKVT